jgi:hypothetical protein
MTRRQLLTMCANNLAEANDGVPVWLPQEKSIVRAAAVRGLVTVEVTAERLGGLPEWRVRLASPSSSPKGSLPCAS